MLDSPEQSNLWVAAFSTGQSIPKVLNSMSFGGAEFSFEKKKNICENIK